MTELPDAAIAADRSGRNEPAPGDVVFIGREASVQFAGASAFNFRVIRVDPRITYHGWLWLDGYQLDTSGHAAERRSIFVQADGVRPAGVHKFYRIHRELSEALTRTR